MKPVRVLSHQFTRERHRCRIIKGLTFIDKTEINRAEVRVQTVGKGSLLENRRMINVRPGQSLSGEQRRFPLRFSLRDGTTTLWSSVLHFIEGKVHTLCFPGACVLDVSVQIPVISKGDESDRSCCTRGWTTPSWGRRRHWRGTSGAWSRRYAAHRPQRRSSCQDRFPRIDEDTKGSVDCLL